MSSTRKGWGRSATWGTVAEARGAAERWLADEAARAARSVDGKLYGREPDRAKSIYQTRDGRYSIRTGHRLIMTVYAAAAAIEEARP